MEEYGDSTREGSGKKNCFSRDYLYPDRAVFVDKTRTTVDFQFPDVVSLVNPFFSLSFLDHIDQLLSFCARDDLINLA